MLSSSLTRRLVAGIASVAVTVGVAGCGSDDVGEPTGATAFVVGGRSNMPAARLDGQALAALDDAVARQSVVAIVVADGKPALLGERTQLTINGSNGPARDQSRLENRKMLADGITGARAEDEESDLLTALSLAARSIWSVETLPHTIVVVDSGLSTVAPLDFTQPGMLDADPQEIVQSLQSSDALPDLSGMRVVVQGLGDTSAPQVPLTIAQRKNLVAIWQAILAATGTQDVVLEETPLQGNAAQGLPPVTPVPLPEPRVCTATTVTLSGGDVAFEPNSAEFRDPAAAEAVIAPIAEQMRAGGFTATVTGMTADVGDKPGQVRLSQQRAQAVAAVLKAKGVAESQFTSVEGLGSDFPGYVPDKDPDSNLIPAAAAANRKVEIQLTGGGAFACA